MEGSPPVFLKLPVKKVAGNFAGIYTTIDLISYGQAKAYMNTVRQLSTLLVKPFEKQIAACQTIVITIDSQSVRFPIEFLEAGGQPIALARPVVFQINEGRYQQHDLVRLTKGLIIRDPTADPDDACARTFVRYPGSTYRSAYQDQVLPATLKQKQGHDFLLISTHGFVDSLSSCGRVLFKDVPLDSTFFYGSRFKLVYLDACQQGINWSYLSSLSKSSGFYLGPLVSNDSGESSTKTINWFFSSLAKTNDPVKAIWETKNRLFRHYGKKLNILDIVNKAFIFRIYKM